MHLLQAPEDGDIQEVPRGSAAEHLRDGKLVDFECAPCDFVYALPESVTVFRVVRLFDEGTGAR